MADLMFKLNQKWYEITLLILTVCMWLAYLLIYLELLEENQQQYMPLLITGRTLILAGFLIYFYNPLRKTFEYGHALPTFAFAAGISLLLFLDRHDILNLVHFILYRELMPPKVLTK